jgi:hypothetical protein
MALTEKQRDRKLAQARKATETAARLLAELYDDRAAVSYSLVFEQLEAHRAIGRSADALESAQRTMDELQIAGVI